MRGRAVSVRLSILSVLLMAGLTVCSTVVYLDSGEEYEGSITKIRPKDVTVLIDGGGSKTIPIAKVMGLRIDGEMRNGPFDQDGLGKLYPGAIDPTGPGPQRDGAVSSGSGPDSGAGARTAPGDSSPVRDPSRVTPDPAPASAPFREKDIYGYRFALQAKPFNFLIGKSMSGSAPYPARFLVARTRLIGILGFEVEPSLVLGDVGGFGFLIGPTLFQTADRVNPNPVTVSAKYHFVHIDTWGNEGEFLVEVSRQMKFAHFLLGLGGEAGVGITGITVSGGEYSFRKPKILQVDDGIILGFVFDLGFCL